MFDPPIDNAPADMKEFEDWAEGRQIKRQISQHFCDARRNISKALGECTRRMNRTKDQKLFEYWAAKREGLAWAQSYVTWCNKNPRTQNRKNGAG